MTPLFEKLDVVTLPAAGADTAVWGQQLAQLADQKGIQTDEMTLLLHADDGVIWGRLEGQTLTISSDAYPEVAVKLRAQTVQQLRLFGEAGELLIWRSGAGFAGRVVTTAVDTAVGAGSTYDSGHLLWGVKTTETASGFTLLREGARELLHAPPGAGHAATLNVRHYIQYDESGQAYVALSRVLDLVWADTPKGGENNGS